MANLYVRSTDGNDADNGTTWALAKATLAGALAIATNADTIWVSQVHAETAGATKAHTLPTTPGLRILCGNDAAEPPTALATTATVTTTGNFAITFVSGHAYIYGIIFTSGSGVSAAADMLLGSSGAATTVIFDNCALRIGSTSVNAPFRFGSLANTSNMRFELIDTSLKFGSASQALVLQDVDLLFRGVTLDAAGSIPLTLFKQSSGYRDTVLIEASDLSGRAWTNLIDVNTSTSAGILTVRDSKLPASISVVLGAFAAGPGGIRIRLHNCDSADTNYRFDERQYEGAVVHETTIVRTGGASDGTTPLSHNMTSSANTKLWHPLKTMLAPKFNSAVGSSMTATVEIVHDSVTALTDAEVWLEIEYLGTSGVPLGTVTTDRVATVIAAAANQASSSVTWTTTGLANPNKQALVVTFTPQEIGYVLATVCLAKASYTVYVDMKVTLSAMNGLADVRQMLMPGLGYINEVATAGGAGGGSVFGGLGGVIL